MNPVFLKSSPSRIHVGIGKPYSNNHWLGPLRPDHGLLPVDQLRCQTHPNFTANQPGSRQTMFGQYILWRVAFIGSGRENPHRRGCIPPWQILAAWHTAARRRPPEAGDCASLTNAVSTAAEDYPSLANNSRETHPDTDSSLSSTAITPVFCATNADNASTASPRTCCAPTTSTPRLTGNATASAKACRWQCHHLPTASPAANPTRVRAAKQSSPHQGSAAAHAVSNDNTTFTDDDTRSSTPNPSSGES